MWRGSPYAINASNASGTGLGNYAISYAPGALTVNPAQITVTALGGSSVYGSSPTNPGLSATGLQNGESVGVLTGLANSFGVTATSGIGAGPLHAFGPGHSHRPELRDHRPQHRQLDGEPCPNHRDRE